MKKVIKRKVILFSLPFLLLLLPILAFFALFVGSSDSSSDTNINVNTSQQQVAKTIWDKALKEGGTKEGAAALIGNNQHESGGLIPSAIQGQAPYDEAKAMNKSIDGYGFGLPQMDGGRRVNMLNYAKSQNKSWTDTNIQVEYMFEHDGADSTLLKQLVKETNVKQATEDIMRKWERAGAVDSLSQRQEYAQYWYTFFTTGGNSGTGGGSGITPDIP